jgi:hypothetical protein
MPSPGTTHAQLRQLKKAIQAEVHRTTGRRPPLLSDDVAFEDPITFENLAPDNAWYILPNTTNGNKIHHLYKKSTLNQILATSRKSPFTRKPITNGNVRKYMNFKIRTSAPVVVNLTGSPQRRSHRPRHGLFSDVLVQTQLKHMLLADRTNVSYKIYILNPSESSATCKKSFTIEKSTAPNASIRFVFHASGPDIVATASTFSEKLRELLQSYPPTIYYVGYRRTVRAN